MAAAYFLNRHDDVQVSLLERSPTLGMDAHRVDVPIADQLISIDVPSRMLSALQWPTMLQLYQQVGVTCEQVDASQSFSRRRQYAVGETYLKVDVALRPESALLQMLSAKPRAILSEAKRLLTEGRRDLDAGLTALQTLGEYLTSSGYSHAFKTEFLYPTLSSTVCTCDYAALDAYPAGIILPMLRKLTDDRALYRTRYGTRDVVSRLTEGLSDVRTGVAARSIVRWPEQVAITFSDGVVETFDHAIIATQANTAISLQPNLPEIERQVLQSIPYQDVHVIVHSDANLMPAKRSDWRTFNMIAGSDNAICTVWLNRFDANCESLPDLFQTICPTTPVQAASVHAQISLQRPVVHANSMLALGQLADLHKQEDRRLWYCGSWAWRGVPLLETAVLSAQAVAERIARGAVTEASSRSAP